MEKTSAAEKLCALDRGRGDRRPSLKRETILDAARETFLEYGYAATSMDTVAAKAGVSKATIYAHFAGKNDLFGAVIRSGCDHDIGVWPDGGDARSTLTTMANRLLSVLLKPSTLAMYRVVVAEAARHPELASAFWDAGPGQGKIKFTAMFQRLMDQGELDVPDPWLAADQFSAMMRGEVFHRMLLGLPAPEGYDAKSTVDAAVDTILRAYARR